MGLLIPQRLALPLSGTALGSGPSALEGDRELASPVFSGSSAPLERRQVYCTPGVFPGPVSSPGVLGDSCTCGCGARRLCTHFPAPLHPEPLGVASLGAQGGLGLHLPLLIPCPLSTCSQSGTKRTGTGSAATAVLGAGTASAGAGAETGATGTSAVPPGTGGDAANL